MDFWAATNVVLRRWYVAVTAFLLTLGGAYGVYLVIPVNYVSTGVMVLTIPTTGSFQVTDSRRPQLLINPLLNFDGGLNMSASILVQILNTPETAADLGVVKDGPVTYTVNNGHPNPELLFSTPMVMIEGKSTVPAEAQNIVRKAVKRAREELLRRQRQLGAPPSTYITITEMVPATTPLPQRNGKLRFVAAVLVLGALAALASSFATESVAAGLRRRKAQKLSAADQGQSTTWEAAPKSTAGLRS
ncbi:hypothetical protein JOL79_21670 [Microbispora sp. RL4-1S]|uniref:Polysaccharide chain length determinant N-terminal domain-containing protein n=1 Tax=Microbispora oryzae TaxID=2806554 RepID=A0A941ALM2_9ACTN|nr:hypothetical protein [Microbispora oryzae]MBP2706423.1 hypothetical protein [Microbispora oryzae]